MLIEISCSKFKTPKHPTEVISFHPGLNVVLGNKNGANSIGKSTMLMIIDFAFGGSSYVKSDAVIELGNHEIFFTFRFSNQDYRFSRDTANPDVIREHLSKDIFKEIHLPEYTQWLCHQYKMDYPGVSFRNTISRFFRIYKKSKIDEMQPLKIRESENNTAAINVLLCLFNHHNEISYFQNQLKSAKDKHSAFRTAQKYNFIASAITRQKEYEEAQSKLAELRQEKEDLAFSNNSSVDRKEVKKANQINELKRYLRDARKKLEQKKNDIHLVDLNLQLGVQPTEADLNNLLTFFPHANIEKLAKIEKFHHKIQSILKDELLETKRRMEQELLPLQNQVDKIQNYIEQLKPSMAFSDEFLTAYTKLDHEITTLENECDNFINLQNLNEIEKQAKKALEERTTLLLHQMEKSINAEMEKISDFISHGEDNAPILRLLKSNSYTFETPRDSGTATNYKGMLIYDLSILELTPLPALAHDSLLFPNISDEKLRQLLRLYASIEEKQVFIAFDRQDNLGPDISSLLNKHAVIKLGPNDEALFGIQWGKKK
ncbi:DUF2326 domain-containing protein [Megasphaera elsdenii]|uniref:DUF2326 domain-containing protein n=1 Tax=Megasphaera elsdenii TaxID=907 RepID=UPI00403545DD